MRSKQPKQPAYRLQEVSGFLGVRWEHLWCLIRSGYLVAEVRRGRAVIGEPSLRAFMRLRRQAMEAAHGV